MDAFNAFLVAANSVLWHDSVLFIILGTGVLSLSGAVFRSTGP